MTATLIANDILVGAVAMNINLMYQDASNDKC